jgi:hypothetical protein
MKIGIMTLWQSNGSYGQLLQHYALQQFLRDLGHEPYLIRYDPKQDLYKSPTHEKILKIFNPVLFTRYIMRKYRMLILNKEEKNDNRKFNLFRWEYIRMSDAIYHSYTDLAKHPPQADVYIVGSDTVWDFLKQQHPERINRLYKSYFLDFGNRDVQRIAFAASANVESLDKNVLNTVKPLLEKFRYITVREKQTLDIFINHGIGNVEWVCDPTMLLDAGVYRTIYKNISMENVDRKYCLLYKINISDNISINKLYNWAKSKDLKVVYVGEGQIDHHEKINASICEWLSLIDNAEYVITNSFHGTIFSLIFKKQFAVFPLTGEYNNANVRFYSLFEYFGIERRFIVGDNFDILDNPINWETIAEKIKIIKGNNVLLRL